MKTIEERWPPFVASWSEASLGFEGLSGRVLECSRGSTMFMAADRDVFVPPHRHGAQWGIVLAGTMELTMDGVVTTYGPGQTHYIPAGVEHEAVLHAGWQGLYVFDRIARPL